MVSPIDPTSGFGSAAAPVTTTPNAPGDGAEDGLPADEITGATGGAVIDPASPTDVPPPPGRAAPVSSVATQPPAPDVDPQSVNDLAAQLVPMLRDSLADALEVGRETLQAGATYFAPLIAKQAILESSTDPRISAKATGHKRHLNAQFLMRAAENGIPLQQRQEQKALTVLNTVVRVGIHLATGMMV